MLCQDDYKSAAKYSELTLEFLTQHHLAPSPINYSVIYLLVSERHPQLKTDINVQLANKNALDSVFIEMMFDKHLTKSEHFDQNFLEPLLGSLSTTVKLINDQVDSGRTISSNLEKVDLALSKNKYHQPLQEVVNYLIHTVKDSREQQVFLSQELAKTTNEVNHLKSKLRESKQEAVLDALTGLLNRRGSNEKLKELTLNETHSSLMIDIDHFKNFNDRFGHFIGDRVLQKVAHVIQDCVSSNDIAVRFGGEEFLVVLVNQAKSEASLVAEKIRQTVNQLKLIQRRANVTLPKISVSIGVVEMENDPSWDELFKRADEALYIAKNRGRNRCILA